VAISRARIDCQSLLPSWRRVVKVRAIVRRLQCRERDRLVVRRFPFFLICARDIQEHRAASEGNARNKRDSFAFGQHDPSFKSVAVIRHTAMKLDQDCPNMVSRDFREAQ
jgi:hypothetical protein